MKVRLAKDMQLVITPEDWVEQAALSRWCEVHQGEGGLLIEAYAEQSVQADECPYCHQKNIPIRPKDQAYGVCPNCGTRR